MIPLSGDPQLVRAALEAVPQWRYAPSKYVRVTIVTINFSLKEGGGLAPGEGGGVGRVVYSVGDGLSAPSPFTSRILPIPSRQRPRNCKAP